MPDYFTMTGRMRAITSMLLAFILTTILSLGSASPIRSSLELEEARNFSDDMNEEPIFIAGIFEFLAMPWLVEVFEFTVELLNNHTNGFHDDVLVNTTIHYELRPTQCEADNAVKAYLNVSRASPKPHAIFGGTCSGPSMAFALTAGVEEIPILSHTASSAKLSDKDTYPTFTRLVAPDDASGQVGALVALLDSFGWNRVSVIKTDNQYTKDLSLEFSSVWRSMKGKDIVYSDTVRLNGYETVPSSVRQVLSGIPVDSPSINSRVVVLLAHNLHAYSILQMAKEMDFQPDTIWIGIDGWTGWLPGDPTWLPPVPGSLGLVPYRNFSLPVYKDFLSRLQDHQRTKGKSVSPNLQSSATDLVVDGVVALAKALSSVPPHQRRDGNIVVSALRNLSFDGVSGHVSFTENGDRASPTSLVLNLPSSDGDWVTVGTAAPDQVIVDKKLVCFAEFQCGYIPQDVYPLLNKNGWPIWVWTVLLGVALLLAVLLYLRQRHKVKTGKEKLQTIHAQIDALDSDDKAVRDKRAQLYKEIASLLEQRPENWTEIEPRTVLADVTPAEKDYWDVLDRLRETMGEKCYISKLSRIQNEKIWSYYIFRKHKLASMFNKSLDDPKLNEEIVWHGTSNLNPRVIHNDDKDVGFMLQFAQQGLWGHGIYFADRSEYSDYFAFKPLNEYTGSSQEDREIFLVRLLVGRDKFMNRDESEAMRKECEQLVEPPVDENGIRYDAVSGIASDGTKVYVVYENGRAYPEYLVRYYKGPRDPLRTTFETKEDAMGMKKEQGQVLSPAVGAMLEDKIPTSRDNVFKNEEEVIWQFEDENGLWQDYDFLAQDFIENVYRHDSSGKIVIEEFPWSYELDTKMMVQTNLQHPDRKQARIRRVVRDRKDGAK